MAFGGIHAIDSTEGYGMTQPAPIPVPVPVADRPALPEPAVPVPDSPPGGERAAVSAAARKTIKAVSRLPLTLPRMRVSVAPARDE